MATTDPARASRLWRRVAWMLAIWCASVAALGITSLAIKAVIGK